MSKWVSVNEAASIKKVTRQAIYLAIRTKKLKAYMKNEKLRVNIDDLADYWKKRRSRVYHSFVEGKRIYSKGNLNVNQVAEKLGIDKQKVYYAIRSNLLKVDRIGGVYVIKSKDFYNFKRWCSNRSILV